MRRTLLLPIFSILLVVAAFSVVSGCMKDHSPSRYYRLGQSYELESSEFEECRRRADRGDKDAAFKLYFHYAIGVGDAKTGESWLRRAVDLGHMEAKGHLEALSEPAKGSQGPRHDGTPVADPFGG
jgi:hypothetical protein